MRSTDLGSVVTPRMASGGLAALSPRRLAGGLPVRRFEDGGYAGYPELPSDNTPELYARRRLADAQLAAYLQSPAGIAGVGGDITPGDPRYMVAPATAPMSPPPAPNTSPALDTRVPDRTPPDASRPLPVGPGQGTPAPSGDPAPIPPTLPPVANTKPVQRQPPDSPGAAVVVGERTGAAPPIPTPLTPTPTTDQAVYPGLSNNLQEPSFRRAGSLADYGTGEGESNLSAAGKALQDVVRRGQALQAPNYTAMAPLAYGAGLAADTGVFQGSGPGAGLANMTALGERQVEGNYNAQLDAARIIEGAGAAQGALGDQETGRGLEANTQAADLAQRLQSGPPPLLPSGQINPAFRSFALSMGMTEADVLGMQEYAKSRNALYPYSRDSVYGAAPNANPTGPTLIPGTGPAGGPRGVPAPLANVPPNLLHYAATEGFDPRTSSSGAAGWFQIKPTTAQDVDPGATAEKLADPGYSTWIMSGLDQQYGQILTDNRLPDTPANRVILHQYGKGDGPRLIRWAMTNPDKPWIGTEPTGVGREAGLPVGQVYAGAVARSQNGLRRMAPPDAAAPVAGAPLVPAPATGITPTGTAPTQLVQLAGVAGTQPAVMPAATPAAAPLPLARPGGTAADNPKIRYTMPDAADAVMHGQPGEPGGVRYSPLTSMYIAAPRKDIPPAQPLPSYVGELQAAAREGRPPNGSVMAAVDAQVANSSRAGTEAQNAAPNLQAQLTDLATIKDTVNRIDTTSLLTKPGALSAERGQLANLMTTIGIKGVSPENVATLQELQKTLKNAALTGPLMGTQGAELAENALGASPNPEMQTDVIRLMVEINRQKAALAAEANQRVAQTFAAQGDAAAMKNELATAWHPEDVYRMARTNVLFDYLTNPQLRETHPTAIGDVGDLVAHANRPAIVAHFDTIYGNGVGSALLARIDAERATGQRAP